ncbi:hypothetical protein QJQ45_024786 [Haematococcus lacustris]|nr:hypothetical protein QJQ45_024786 [Haematococcus lacustris]
MSLVAQCLRGSGPVPRSKSRFRLKARENKVRRSRGVVCCNCAVRAPTPPAVQPPRALDAAPLPPLPTGVHFVKVDSRVLHGVCQQLGLTRETAKVFTTEPARSNHWDRWFSTGKLANQGFEFERTVETDGVNVCVHYTRPLPTPPAPPSAAGPSSSNSSPVAAPGAAAVAAHELGLPRIGKGIAEVREFVFDPDTQIGVGIDPGVTQAVSAASGVWDPMTGQLQADQLRRWKLTKDQRLRLYGAQDRALEQFFKKLEENMAEVSMKRHERAKQLVVFFGAASIGTAGGWGADAVLRACRKVVCRIRGTDQLRGRVVLVDEHRTTRVSSAVNGKQPCEVELNTLTPTGPTQQPGSHTGSSLRARAQHSQPAKRSKRTKAEPEAAEPSQPTKGKAKGKAAKAKPAPQPGRWLGRDCNAALNMQRIGESKWRPLELCY